VRKPRRDGYIRIVHIENDKATDHEEDIDAGVTELENGPQLRQSRCGVEMPRDVEEHDRRRRKTRPASIPVSFAASAI
jgi:hypothetical protein